jgi:hypothetical protein
MNAFTIRSAIPLLASVLLAVATLAGCAGTPSVRTEAAPGENVAARRAYAWDESRISWPEPAPVAIDAELRGVVRDAVAEQLASRGYTEDTATPEFVVSFHATVRDVPADEFCMIRNRVIGIEPSRLVEVCRILPGTTRVERGLKRGTLVVFVVDRARGVLLWQGVAEDTASTVPEARSRIRELVAKMFRDFPARAS